MRALKAIGSPLIKDVRGVGLLIGIELSEEIKVAGGGSRPTALAVVDLLHEAGLLSVPSGAQPSFLELEEALSAIPAEG